MDWVSRDGKLIVVGRGIRALAMSMLSVLIGIYLGHLGFGLTQIGLFLTLGTAGGAAQALIVGVTANATGYKVLLVGLALLASMAGLLIGFTESFPVLAALAFVGGLNAAGGSGGGSGFGPLEQSTLPDTTDATNRTRLFAWYGIVGTAAGAVGALAAGLPTPIHRYTSFDQADSERVMFFAFAILLFLVALLYLWLSPGLGRSKTDQTWGNPFRLESRRTIFTLTGLFSVDRFAGSLVIQSLVAYWFSTRFGFQLDAVAGIFFLSNVLAGVSLWLAAKVADRPAEHDGVHTHPIKPVLDRGGFFAVRVVGSGLLGGPVIPRADGRTDP